MFEAAVSSLRTGQIEGVEVVTAR